MDGIHYMPTQKQHVAVMVCMRHAHGRGCDRTVYVYYMLYKNASQPTCPAASCSRYPPHTSKNTCTCDTYNAHTLGIGRNPSTGQHTTYMMLCNSPALDLWPINNALLVAHLGPMLRAMSIPMQHIPHHMRICTGMPPTFRNKATDPALPATVNVKHHFWEVWNAELQHRQEIMQNKPLQWKALMQSYQRTNAIMPYAPHTHLRRLCKVIDRSCASELDMPGQWVYMVWTVLDPRPYFGQCGALGGPKTVIQRFSEEVTAARSCTIVYGNKRRRVPLFIYLLRKLGTHAFSVVPVRRTTVSSTDRVEIWHIHHSVPNMNTNHTKRGQ